MDKETFTKYAAEICILLGLLLILYFSFVLGFVQAFSNMFSHIVKDFTIELSDHLYIAGWLLLIYGLYKLAGKRFLS
ncbi:MAG: hypothetical protein HY362_00175 [Candidatus Aenigmarchaeota archaeon]|nr:hypothetical protein [Candidatus Aenigmarchaeota archaeon]